jgi:hypothetical protein
LHFFPSAIPRARRALVVVVVVVARWVGDDTTEGNCSEGSPLVRVRGSCHDDSPVCTL